MQHTNNTEKGFQHLVIKHLVKKNKYIETFSTNFDHEFCIYKTQ